MAKDTNLRIRLNLEERGLIERAAKEVHSEINVSAWARGVLKAEALRVLNGLPFRDAELDAKSSEVEVSVTVPLTPKQQEKAKALVEANPEPLSTTEVSKTTSNGLPAFDNGPHDFGITVKTTKAQQKVIEALIEKDKEEKSSITKEDFEKAAKELRDRGVPKTDFKEAKVYRGLTTDILIPSQEHGNPPEKKPLSPALQKLLESNPKLQMMNKEGIVEEPEGEPEYEYAPEDHEVVATLHRGQPVDIAEKAFARGGAIVYFKLSGLVYKAEFKPQTSVCIAYSNGDWYLVSSPNWGVRKGVITVTKK